MTKHELVLKSLFYNLKDDLDDAWHSYNDAKMLKELEELDIARFKLTDAKARVDHSEIVKEKIESYIRKHSLDTESPHKVFYHYILEKLDELKMKIQKCSI